MEEEEEGEEEGGGYRRGRKNISDLAVRTEISQVTACAGHRMCARGVGKTVRDGNIIITQSWLDFAGPCVYTR